MKTKELPPGQAITYFTNGNGEALLKGGKETYEYKFRQSNDKRLVFVISGYTYLGYAVVVDNGGHLTINAGRRGNRKHPAFNALAWYLNKAIKKPEVAKQATFLEVVHENE